MAISLVGCQRPSLWLKVEVSWILALNRGLASISTTNIEGSGFKKEGSGLTPGKLYQNLSPQSFYVRQADGSYDPEQALPKGAFFLFIARVGAGYKVLYGEHVGIIRDIYLTFPNDPSRYFMEVLTGEKGKALPTGS